MPVVKTIAELRQAIAAKEKLVARLRADRGAVEARLVKIDRQIAALTGEPAPAKRGRKPAAPKPVAAKAPKEAPQEAPAAPGKGKPLADYIRKVLAGSKAGMRVRDIAKAVRQSGYKTQSKHFYTSVAAALRDYGGFEKVDRGVYRLKAAAPAQAPKAAAPQKAAAKAPKAAKAPRAPKAGSLKGLLVQALKGKKAVSVSDAMQAVLGAGYKTESKDFRLIVNQTLLKSDLFKNVGRGMYAMK